MKLYICYGTWTVGKPLHAHPCGEANKALVEAGYQPELVRSYGLGLLPGLVNDRTEGRRAVKELTGNYWVPVLVTDDGTVIQGAEKIIAWAWAHPANTPDPTTTGNAGNAGNSAGRATSATAG